MAIDIDREGCPSLQSHFKPDELFSGSYEELMEIIHNKMANKFRELIYKNSIPLLISLKQIVKTVQSVPR